AAVRAAAAGKASRSAAGVAVLPRGGRPAAKPGAGAGRDRPAQEAALRGPLAEGGAVPSARAAGGREQRRHDAEARNRRSRELKGFRDRIAALEASIVPLETRLKELETAMSGSETYKEPGLARRLGEEKKAIEIELAHLYDDWAEATSDLQ